MWPDRSIVLADLGVDCLLVERHPSTSHLPKAHLLSQRTMEIFRHHGIADSVYEQGAPLDKMSKVRFATSLGGDSDLDRRTIFSIDAYGAGRCVTDTRPTAPSSAPIFPRSGSNRSCAPTPSSATPAACCFTHNSNPSRPTPTV